MIILPPTMQDKPLERLHRIGIVLGPGKELPTNALQYLILHMNAIQHTFEFQVYPLLPGDPFFQTLSDRHAVNRRLIIEEASPFLSRYRTALATWASKYGLTEEVPRKFIVFTTARFNDNFYSVKTEGLGILALGNWERHMAPPSIVEFYLVLMVQMSVGLVEKRLARAIHAGTKGCLWDFTPILSDVRYQILNGFICSNCKAALAGAGFSEVSKDLERILSGDWLGSSDDPQSPAATSRKLGYDLFRTKGLQPTLWESLASVLRQEAVKQLLRIFSGLILAALLLWLGLKDNGETGHAAISQIDTQPASSSRVKGEAHQPAAESVPTRR